MGTTNLAFGDRAITDSPFSIYEAGLKTPLGLALPGTGQVVAYVRSYGDLTGPAYIEERRVATLAQGLARCRPGFGDTVIVMPGHVETITDGHAFDNLVKGCNVIGWGNPNQDDAPTISLTNTAAQLAIAVKNVFISGLRLLLDGANGVVNAINITAAGVTLYGNYIEVASGAALKAVIGITVGAGAHQCTIRGNRIVGTATHNLTDGIKVTAAVFDLDISDNQMQFSVTAANGLIHVTAAALRLSIKRNELYNTMTSSSAALAVDDVAADGIISYNNLAVLANSTASADGITFGTSALCKAFQNFCSDEPKKSGLLSPVAAT